jgi:hypothetical protein
LLANETLADSPGAARLGDSPWENFGKISLWRYFPKIFRLEIIE